MRDVVVCQPLRTPIGRYGGVFKDVTATTLAATVLRAIIDRAGIDPAVVEDVILGQCYPNGEAPAIGRVAALDAGMPTTVVGLQLDRRCGSGLQAVLDASMRVQTGVADLVLAGGVESMSQAEHYVLGARWGLGGSAVVHDRLVRGRVTAGGRNHPVPGGMIETAENLRAEYAISREAQDQLAYRSQQRAKAAAENGRFTEEIVPVEVTGPKGTELVVEDEHPRPDTTPQALASLKAIRRRTDPASTVTAGNASGQNDAAAACIVTHPARAEQLGLRPLGRLVTWGVAGVEPERMGIGPVPASEQALRRAGLRMEDIDLVELNEAFAVQVLAVLREWQMDPTDERLNVNGSGISLGHPVGATGARILATMLHELDRREGRYAMETMCIGGGQGLTAIFERP